MTKKQNILSTVTPWDMVAEGYSETTMKLFQGYADTALALSSIDKHSDVLDVACGPGTLTLAAAKQAKSVSAIDFSEKMVTLLQQTIQHTALDNINVHRGDGQALPYNDASFDAAFSMFGLMFFPDRRQGYAEIYRTLKPGGSVVISSWAPVCESPAMQTIFGTLRTINPDIPEPKTDIESLENPDFFEAELKNTGFKDIAIHSVTQDFPLSSVDEFWNDMVKGHALVVMLKNSMSDEAWEEKSQRAITYLKDVIGSGPTSLPAVALLGVGRK